MRRTLTRNALQGYEEAEEVNELEGGCEACGEGIDCDDSDEGDEMANMAEVEDRELTIACARRQSRWERHEELATERRERDLKNEKNRAPDQAAARLLSMEQAIAEERQIFAPREAFTMLSRELLDLIRKGASEHADIYADAVGDDVYQWDVRLTGFGRETALAQVRLSQCPSCSGSSISPPHNPRHPTNDVPASGCCCKSARPIWFQGSRGPSLFLHLHFSP